MNTHKRNLQHPVWDIYDEYRTARLNVKINEYQLTTDFKNNSGKLPTGRRYLYIEEPSPWR
jgi:hypothetical protein